MDLGTIKKGIVDRKYKTLEEVDENVRLVWSNCMTYNQDGSDFYLLAQMLNKKWNDKLKKLKNELGLTSSSSSTGGGASGAGMMNDTTGSSSNKISIEDKRAFAKSLYKISKEELGKILVEVEMKCPTALTRNAAEDEVELNVDKLNPSIMNDLQNFVKNCGGGGGGSKKKKSSSQGGDRPNKRAKM